MAKSPKKYTAQEKSSIALDALKERLTINELTSKYGVHATQINRWKKHLKENISKLFSENFEKPSKESEVLISELYQRIGQLSVELEWLKKKADLFS